MKSTEELLDDLAVSAGGNHGAELRATAEGLYENILEIYRGGSVDDARKHTLRALEILDGTDNTSYWKGQFYTALSDFNYLSGLHREALLCSYNAADWYSRAGKTGDEVQSRSNCGGLLLNFGDYVGAYDQLLLACELAEEQDMPVQEGQCRLNIATILKSRGETENAREELQRAEELFARGDYPSGRSFCLNSLAEILRNAGEYEEACDKHREALGIAGETKTAWDKLMMAGSFGTTLLKAGKPREALNICNETLSSTPEDESPDYRADLLMVKAEALIALCKPDTALEVIQAAENLYSTTQGCEQDSCELLRLKAEALHLKADSSEAFNLLTEYLKKKDELRKNEKKQELSEMRVVTEVKTALQRDEISLKNFELEEANKKLREALEQVHTLSGMLPICSSCKRIRDDSGYWQQIESYISSHSAAQFSHSLCSDCLKKKYPEMEKDHD